MSGLNDCPRVATTPEGFTIVHTDAEFAEFYVCELMGEMVIPLRGPYASVQEAHEASREHGPLRDPSPAAIAALHSMVRMGTWKFEETARAPKRRRKW